ncbi:HAD-IA family hydrolase [Pseudarthrobacter sp. H2]|uniref:HAD-IA family hydrolase n=1 Tax=Pseudarthrobacter sp. H2 TaxID=3418415 RepID=UPI003CE8B6E0
MDQWVLFDVGGVLIDAPLDFDEFATILDTADDGALRTAFERNRAAYDAGGSASEFWGAVAADLRPGPVPTETVLRLVAAECRRWVAPSEAVTRLVHGLRSAGYRLAILSNAPVELAAAMRASTLGAEFDVLLFSSEIGASKPAAESYLAALAALQSAPERIVFFDDRPENVESALRLGLRATLWPGADVAALAL